MAFRHDQYNSLNKAESSMPTLGHRKEQWTKMQEALRSQNGWGSKYVDNTIKWNIPADSSNYGSASANESCDVWNIRKRKDSPERYASYDKFDYAEHGRNIAGNFGQYTQKSPHLMPLKHVCLTLILTRYLSVLSYRNILHRHKYKCIISSKQTIGR